MKELPKYLVVGLGGALGANARYIISGIVHHRWPTSFPYGTLIINLSGSFILGLFATIAIRYAWNDYWRLLIAIGFLGAFTTFSTFEYDTLRLIADGSRYRAAFANILGSVVVGFIAAWLGVMLARAIIRIAAWA